ncbi:MAG: alpha/beta fold hydrolase [Chloroflexota bacterium]
MPDPHGTEQSKPQPAPVETQTVRSADGTQIGFARIGFGPVPLVIVHAALNSAKQWLSVAEALAEHCTCYVMDRRGRGRSGDAEAYVFDREIEDIIAVLQAAGPDAFLMGHSSGAVYALEAARRQSIAGLVLYEPPLHVQRQFKEIFDRIRPLMQQERFDDAVTLFFREEAGVPEEQLSVLRSTPLWRHMVKLAPTADREWEALLEAGLKVERFREVSTPTLLLTGTLTKDHTSFATKALQRTLPDAQTVLLEGQAHSAHRAAPELVATEVADFIGAVRP